MIRISYLVPVYNAEKYIARCIESCLSNMSDSDELILVNDGSVDGSGNICDAYAQERNNIKVIHQKNTGGSAARNIGLESASGEWIICVDADDYLDKDARADLEKLNADTDVVLYSYQQDDVSEQRMLETSGKRWTYGRTSRDNFIKGCFRGELDFAPLGKLNPRTVWGKAFRRTFIEQNRIRFHEGVFIGEDFEFMLECYSKANQIQYVDRVLYHYFFQNNDSITNKFKPDLVENTIRSREAMQAWLREFPQYSDDYAAYCLNFLVLHIRDDFYHEDNKMNAGERHMHMEDVIKRGGYKEYYDAAAASGRLGNYPLSKRILFFLSVHKQYRLLWLIYNIRYRLMA